MEKFQRNDYKIIHYIDDQKHDYDVSAVPMDFLLPLARKLSLEYTIRSAAACAPSFREERALQHERYMEKMQNLKRMNPEDFIDPQQIFLDFPIF